ncbi:hypothetical protein BsWGS_08316 [Bradybaena similaris]
MKKRWLLAASLLLTVALTHSEFHYGYPFGPHQRFPDGLPDDFPEGLEHQDLYNRHLRIRAWEKEQARKFLAEGRKWYLQKKVTKLLNTMKTIQNMVLECFNNPNCDKIPETLICPGTRCGYTVDIDRDIPYDMYIKIGDEAIKCWEAVKPSCRLPEIRKRALTSDESHEISLRSLLRQGTQAS